MWSWLESSTCLNPRTQRPTSSSPRYVPASQDDVRAHLPFDGLEISAHEGADVLDELGLALGLEVALGLGFHQAGIGPTPLQLESFRARASTYLLRVGAGGLAPPILRAKEHSFPGLLRTRCGLPRLDSIGSDGEHDDVRKAILVAVLGLILIASIREQIRRAWVRLRPALPEAGRYPGR
jgi:hypothetical protein